MFKIPFYLQDRILVRTTGVKSDASLHDNATPTFSTIPFVRYLQRFRRYTIQASLRIILWDNQLEFKTCSQSILPLLCHIKPPILLLQAIWRKM
jgi:hypothetical protein